MKSLLHAINFPHYPIRPINKPTISFWAVNIIKQCLIKADTEQIRQDNEHFLFQPLWFSGPKISIKNCLTSTISILHPYQREEQDGP